MVQTEVRAAGQTLGLYRSQKSFSSLSLPLQQQYKFVYSAIDAFVESSQALMQVVSFMAAMLSHCLIAHSAPPPLRVITTATCSFPASQRNRSRSMGTWEQGNDPATRAARYAR